MQTWEYPQLAERIGAFIRDPAANDFGNLALAIHQMQARQNAPYGKFCAGRAAPAAWWEIPAVPLDAFRHFSMIAFPPEEIRTTFRTSGTTGEGYGQHHFSSLALYETAALSGWRQAGLPEGNVRALLASEQEACHSSLSYMAAWLTNRFYLRGGEFQWDALERGLAGAGSPVCLFGTALGFLNWFDRLGDHRLELPPGSLAVETGGYKGADRSLPKDALYALFERHLGLAGDAVVNEYGMTELSSQFYTRGLGRPHRGGHWVRARVIDPATGGEAADGETGVLRIFDLANLGSALALQTRDLAVRRGADFELIGRDPQALPRGCSRAVR
ncbi:MAG TPA: hypothetical protein VIS74_04995 [Chthoniobacterales bacterium]